MTIKTFLEPGTDRPQDLAAARRACTAPGGAPLRISVVIPARDCGPTIEGVVRPVVEELMAAGAVDEVLVVNHHSTDDTAERAARAGARVIDFSSAGPITEIPDSGKGSVMWKGIWASDGDIVVFIDGDHLRFDSSKVSRLIGPLLGDASLQHVRAFYDQYGGGRTTEAMARPMLSLLHPELAGMRQPLSGEHATRRATLAELVFPVGWGTEFGILDQICRRHGAAAIGQVDLQYKEHVKGDWAHISMQAFELLYVAMRTEFRAQGRPLPEHWGSVVLTPGDRPGEVLRRPARTGELPPLMSLPGWPERERQRLGV
ncbi:glycosyltransferase [Streptomyces triculaminicus]|uniref:Glucosyl-3-phosphoglycerate synthase n=2 Tax=Streptomyces TaxID=1883 RepID=A0A939JNP2_9ACTN|nr:MULTISPECIES: glycosyltransferase [Streptomyces]MBO0651360.1 glycosyltransferase [Streptomyces triculaminicus]QSY49674.1 glycosyltransferase [Streptomyces griseocarneus]